MSYRQTISNNLPGHAINLNPGLDVHRASHGNMHSVDVIDPTDINIEMSKLEMSSTKELIEQLQSLKPLIDKSKQEISQASAEQRLNATQADLDHQTIKQKNVDLSKELREKDTIIKTMQAKLDEFEGKACRKNNAEIAELEGTKVKLLQRITELDTEGKRAKQYIDSLTYENTSLRKKVKELDEKNRSLGGELDATKTRLSKIIGDQITDNNPDIANLSDENRPTKIAEKYSELYDNDWTDAYEAMEEIIKDEKAVISYLLRILKFIMKQCVRIAEQHSVKITEAVYYTECMPSTVHTEIKKPIKDIRKVAAPFTSKQVQKELLNLIKKRTNESFPATHKKAVQEYIKKCTNICWLMVVQDPPLFFDLDVTEYEEFDKSRYREYTKSGSRIEFLVWPAMYLKKGTLLVKGVAQGYGAKDQTRPQTAPPALQSDVSSLLQSQRTRSPVRPDLMHSGGQSNSGCTGQTQDRNYEQSTNNSPLQDKSSYMSKSVRSTPTHQGNANVNIINRADFYQYPPLDVPQEKWRTFLYYAHYYRPDYTSAKTYTGQYYQLCLSHYRYLLYGETTA